MLASGRPVVAGTAPHTGLAREMAACGLAVVPELPAAMAGAICTLMDDATLWQSCATNARARGRKSGVEGKRGSVRLDPGGRRIVKKKTRSSNSRARTPPY